VSKSIVEAMAERIRGVRLTHEEVDALTQVVEECASHLPCRRETDRVRGARLSAAMLDDRVVVAEPVPAPDPGAHYRGPKLFGIPLDPYRVLEAYPNITREAARHVVKKVLRMGKKGIGERQLIAELRCCIDRWEKMLDEEVSQVKEN